MYFVLVFSLILIFLVSVVNSYEEVVDFPIGAERGISATSTLSTENVQKILDGVEKGNRENIYFYGLMKLYGITINRDPLGAAQQFLRASKLGHKEATTAYGVMMLTGSTGKKNYNEAIKFFREGVSMDDINSYWLLGKMLLEGKGISSPMYTEAALYLQKAADLGIAQAEHSLALMYEYGLGIKPDFAKASMYYLRAVEKNHVESMYNLGLMYAYGRGFPQNYPHARSLFEKAAATGHAQSIYYIGVFKTYGYGCKINYNQAINWFERAASLDDYRVSSKASESAQELRKLVELAHDRNEQSLEYYTEMATQVNR